MIVENSQRLDVQLVNIPKNAGELSTYVFTIPPLNQNLG
jgi:hypothetical protein